MKYPYKSGVTLLELIIVLFIIGLAAGVVTVSLSKMHDKTVIREDMKRIYGVLRLARNTAVMERKEVTFNADEGSVWLEGAASPGAIGAADGKRYPLKGITLKVKQGPIIFYPKGNSTGGLIEMKDSKDRLYYMEVDAVSGNAKIVQ